MSSTWSAASLNACTHFAASSGLLAPNCHTDFTSPFHNIKLLVTEEKSRVLSSSYSKIVQGFVVAYSDNSLKATKPLSRNQCLESKAPPSKAAYPQFVTIVIWVVDYEREQHLDAHPKPQKVQLQFALKSSTYHPQWRCSWLHQKSK
jgi:hypothetical protein